MRTIPLPFSNRQSRRRWRALAITLLLLYLLLFSVFALFHAYAANELDGAHGCNIGQWIHLSFHAAVLFLMVVGAALLFNVDGSAPLPFCKNPPPERPLQTGTSLLSGSRLTLNRDNLGSGFLFRSREAA